MIINKMPWLRVCLLCAGLAAVTACGGGEPADSMDADDMAHDEDMAAEQDAGVSAESFPLGGGMATEVHPGTGGSPHVRTEWELNGSTVAITYGRPLLNGRIVGENVDPYDDNWWRLGADEATTLTSEADLMIGGQHLPAGEYTLFLVEEGDTVSLAVNSETGQWGLDYDSANNLFLVPMETTVVDPPAEQHTIYIEDGRLGFEWGQLGGSVDIMAH